MAVVKSFRQKISETEYGEAINLGADASNVSVSGGGNAQDKFDNIDIELGREITEAEYNALSDEEKNTGTYYITDMDATEASSSDIIYDNNGSTLTSTNVQDAIDEVDNKIEGLDAADVGAVPVGEDGKISGAIIADSSLALSKLAEMPNLADLDGIVGIEGGGTGASTRATAFDALNYLGVNPIASTDDDTVENWKNLGNGYAFYDTAGYLISQPNRYGFLLNHVVYGELAQTFISMPDGQHYYRAGNYDGWSGEWSSKFLPLTGGVLTGNVDIKSGAWSGFSLFDATTNVLVCGIQRSAKSEIVFFQKLIGSNYGEKYYFGTAPELTAEKWYLIYSTKMITAGTSALTSGSSALSTSYIYQQYV